MKESIVAAVGEICNNKALFTLDEASIKSGVILRLLSLLGWNPFDINEVKPEYAIEAKRVDFSLRSGSVNKAFIEVKRPTENLEQHQTIAQLFFQTGRKTRCADQRHDMVVLSSIA